MCTVATAHPPTILALDDYLQAWVARHCPEAAVSFDAPGPEAPEGRGVGFRLVEVTPIPPRRGVSQGAFEANMTYWVSTWGSDVHDAHEMLDTLLFAALQDPTFVTRGVSIDTAAWGALNVELRPGFLLSAAIQRDLTQVLAPQVQRPVEVTGVSMTNLAGVVLGVSGAHEVALQNARVAVRGSRRTVATDREGRFVLHGIPPDPPVSELVVQARGRRQHIPIEAQADGTYVLRFPF
jgi:hypothetical protein